MPAKRQPANPNDHVLEYLDYYCQPSHALDYAVMIKGPWGSGKTFLIKKFMEKRSAAGPAKQLYVSLYGLSSVRQIEDAFYRQLHPVLSSKGMGIAAAVAKGLLKTTLKIDVDGDHRDDLTINSQIPDLNLQEYFKAPKDCLLIFDDLERCAISIPEVLGYINSFVEHDGFKAIVIANEIELLKRVDERYHEIKEKLIGRSLEIQSTVSDAIKNFVQLVTHNRARAFLTRHAESIIDIHKQSETENLRILKQSLWDFERLGSCFTNKHWKGEEAVLILLRLVVALSYQVRSGALKRELFVDVRPDAFARYMRKEKEEAPSLIDLLEKRYPEVRFDQAILSVKLLENLLFDGRLDRDEVRTELNNSPFYSRTDQEPAWRRAWRGWDLDDASYEKAVATVERQFEDRIFVVPGEVLHVFGLRLSFANVGVIDCTRLEVKKQCEVYVDDLVTTGKLKSAYEDPEAFDLGSGWQGLGYTDNETTEFKELVEYYRRGVSVVNKRELPQRAEHLLELLTEAPERYFRALCINSAEQSLYYNIPILATITPEIFAATVIGLGPNAQRVAFTTFKGRYETGRLKAELADELPWLHKVKDALLKHADNLRPMSKYRLNNHIRHNVEPFLI
jgi:hypothetical protein